MSNKVVPLIDGAPPIDKVSSKRTYSWRQLAKILEKLEGVPNEVAVQLEVDERGVEIVYASKEDTPCTCMNFALKYSTYALSKLSCPKHRPP